MLLLKHVNLMRMKIQNFSIYWKHIKCILIQSHVGKIKMWNAVIALGISSLIIQLSVFHYQIIYQNSLEIIFLMNENMFYQKWSSTLIPTLIPQSQIFWTHLKLVLSNCHQ